MDQTLMSLRKGDFRGALVKAAQAEQLYQEKGMTGGQMRALISMSDAFMAIGQYRDAMRTLNRALDLSEKTGDDRQRAAVLNKLGSCSLFMNRLDQAEVHLKSALAIAVETDDPAIKASVLNDLGNVYTLRKDYEKALAVYKESSMLSEKHNNRLLAARIMANMARLLLARGEGAKDIENILSLAYEKHKVLSNSHDKAYGLINIGQGFRQLGSISGSSEKDYKMSALNVLKEAASVAVVMNDNLAASYAFGYIGKIHEDDKAYSEAMTHSRQAVFHAQQATAPESLYLWQWQSGRLFRAQGKTEPAVSLFRDAVHTLQTIRHEVLGDCRIFNQFSFQETIEPLYFEFADLLLKQSESIMDRDHLQLLYSEVRESMELLKTAEMQEYFQDPCLAAGHQEIRKLDTISPDSGIIYAIPFSERLELLLGLQGGMQKVTVNVLGEDFFKEINLFREYVQDSNEIYYLMHAQTLYDYLVRPLEKLLAAAKIKTLVFVPYGPMHKIPIGALHDRKNFLISKYAVAVTPGLTLTDPRPVRKESTIILLAGITRSVQGFPTLSGVSRELEAIHSLYRSTVLKDRNFMIDSMKKEFESAPYNILHIASHADFLEDSRDTYVVAWDGKITMDDLRRITGAGKFRREPLDLLTLSACVTAEGSDRAALGLAGTAVRAGAKSTLASLWEVYDDSTYHLITEFYRQLADKNVSKAAALQKAQIRLINDRDFGHPAYWAAFLLIGNWL